MYISSFSVHFCSLKRKSMSLPQTNSVLLNKGSLLRVATERDLSWSCPHPPLFIIITQRQPRLAFPNPTSSSFFFTLLLSLSELCRSFQKITSILVQCKSYYSPPLSHLLVFPLLLCFFASTIFPFVRFFFFLPKWFNVMWLLTSILPTKFHFLIWQKKRKQKRIYLLHHKRNCFYIFLVNNRN